MTEHEDVTTRDGGNVEPAKKPLIGVAGGIGAGKSAAAGLLAEMGAAVISSDRLNHEELNSPEVVAKLRSWWGPEVLDSSEPSVDRAAIRRIVTQRPDERRRLEGLMHPRVAARRERLTSELSKDPRVRAIVWDSPLLFETGLHKRCDAVLFIDCDETTRRERVARERGWTGQDLERFEKSQEPLDFKRKNADYIVVNNSDLDSLRQQVADVLSQILTGS